MRKSYCTVSLCTSQYLNAMINDYIRKGRLIDAQKVFDENPQCRNIISWNSMMAGYIRNDRISSAQQLFNEMPERDVVSWNTLLLGYRQTGNSQRVLQYFLQMGRIGLRPTEFTMTTIIRAVSDAGFANIVLQVHARVICLAFDSNEFVGTALVHGYMKLGSWTAFQKVFDEIPMKTIALWNAIISSYMNLGCTTEARLAFGIMPERNIVTWTSLLNGYVYNKRLDEASSIFHQMPEKNVVSWTVMISGYEKEGQFVEAIKIFLSMQDCGIPPNQSTFSSVLTACAGCSSLITGKQIHLRILKSSLQVDVILSSSLVNMYAKCGHLNAAVHIFVSMPEKNLVSWNSIIGAYARHGFAERALEQFERMKRDGFRPDSITFVNVLSACGHGGLVQEGRRYFSAMEIEFNVRPEMEHYACMVDLFGRAGHLEKAEKLIREMPFEPDVVVWSALVSACSVHSSLELGQFAAKSMCKLERDHPAIYSMLLKIYRERGAWERVNQLKMMKRIGAKKQEGISWLETSSTLR